MSSGGEFQQTGDSLRGSVMAKVFEFTVFRPRVGAPNRNRAYALLTIPDEKQMHSAFMVS